MALPQKHSYDSLLIQLFKDLSSRVFSADSQDAAFQYVEPHVGVARRYPSFDEDVEETKRQIVQTLQVNRHGRQSWPSGVNSNLDLSPWPLLEMYVGEFVRIHQDSNELLFSDPAQHKVLSLKRQNAALYALSVILMALPLTDISQRSDAFTMKVNFNGKQEDMSPLMYVIKRKDLFNSNEGLLRVLFQRGGFSIQEWQSGLVIMLLANQSDSIIKLLMQNFSRDVQHFINMPVPYQSMQVLMFPDERVFEWSGTVLHFCCHYNWPQILFSKIRYLVTELGADPLCRDSLGRTPLMILQQRYAGTRRTDSQAALQSCIDFLGTLH